LERIVMNLLLDSWSGKIAHREMARWIFDIDIDRDRDLLNPDGTFRTCRLLGGLESLFAYYQLYNLKFGVWNRRSLWNLWFCLRNLTFLLFARAFFPRDLIWGKCFCE
jgi:hypothetical protein